MDLDQFLAFGITDGLIISLLLIEFLKAHANRRVQLPLVDHGAKVDRQEGKEIWEKNASEKLKERFKRKAKNEAENIDNEARTD